MTDALQKLAARAGVDPYYLAFAFQEYLTTETKNETTLLTELSTTPDKLAMARLCPMPRRDPVGFREDVDRIATRFNMNSDLLARIARLGIVIADLRSHVEDDPVETAAPLLAARDRTE